MVKRFVFPFFFIVFIIGFYNLFLISKAVVDETIVTDGIVFDTVDEVVLAGYGKNDRLTLLQTGENNGNIHYVLYTVNQEQLMSELFYKSEAGYERIIDSRLIIGGTPLQDAEYKIRTFLITDGPWLTTGTPFTYVTFGYIQTPEQVDHVEIRYEKLYKKVAVENNSFFNIASSTHQWDTLHPIIFYNQSKEEIGGYLTDLVASGAYCH
jgi:hypothetical protein